MDDALDAALTEARRRRSLPRPEARRMLRVNAGLSQQQVADALGVRRPTVSRWETGARSPRGSALDAYLGVLRRLALEGSGDA